MKVFAITALLFLAACSPAPEPAEKPVQAPMTPAAAPEAPATPPTDAWVGRWTGPEGLFLDIRARDASGTYPMTLKDNLDTQADYAGKASGATIAFTRAGKSETIRAGSGDETGFKYLAGKRDCLIVVAGQEGYCRD